MADQPTGIQPYPIVAGEFDQAAIDEAHAAAIEAKRVADATRDYVLARYKTLRGHLLPVEIISIQNLPSHSCLIVNDYFLFSYVEAKELLEQLE